MNKVLEAQYILKSLGLPPAQCNELSSLTFLALCGVLENDDWSSSSRKSLGLSKGIMAFVNQNYNKDYQPNSRETFRKSVLHHFIQAGIVDYNPDDPSLPVNSPKVHYALSVDVLEVVKSFKTDSWDLQLNSFKDKVGTLIDIYLKNRERLLIPIKLNDGKVLKLSSGKHNLVQAAIIEKFAPRFANGGTLLYLGDTANKSLFYDKDGLFDLGIPINQHSKLPDVVIYDKDRNWLFLIEAVTSHGPVSPKRFIQLEDFLKECNVGRIYVTAFLDMAEFKKHSNNIAWETEVWLVEFPEHMIHFNGDRFMGPR